METRRARKEWPRERPLIMDVERAPKWARDPERLREARRDLGRGLPLILTAFCFPFAILIGLASIAIAERSNLFAGMYWTLGTLAAFTAAGMGMKAAVQRLEAQRRRRALDRLEAHGEATLGGEFVGIAYADRPWRHPLLGDNADHGVLRIDLDRLTFVGRDTRFELPASTIVGTEVRWLDQAFGGSLPRLYVRWWNGGELQAFSVELPYQTSLRRRIEAVSDLQSRIEAWQSAPFPTFGHPPLLPPTIAEMRPAQSKFQRVGLAAMVLAALVTLPILIATDLAVQFVLRRWLGPFGGGVASGLCVTYVFLYIYLAAAIESRLPERWRYRGAAEVPADLGEDRPPDETSIHVSS